MKRHTIVVGLGFGDEGKGTIVDACVRHAHASTVVRFNGGPQAAHHVVTPEGTLHCFAQWGAGTFSEHTETYLSKSMFIEPMALLREADVLEEKGCILTKRMVIHEECVLITPFHRLINRMKEAQRGGQRHGSCGLGVGEAFMDTLRSHYPCVQMRDIYKASELKRKLSLLWMLKKDVAEQMLEAHPEHELLHALYADLQQDDWVDFLVETYTAFIQDPRIQIVSSEDMHIRMQGWDAYVWEGAQGVLLDAEHGFWPHVTPSKTTPTHADMHLASAHIEPSDIMRLGVTRSYMTRHGAGPFVSESSWLRKKLPEPHNGQNDWQGHFRIGWLDCLMLRYAVRLAHNIDGLALTHLDRMAGLAHVQLCTAYRFTGPTEYALDSFFVFERSSGEVRIRDIRVPEQPCRTFQTELTRMLRWCQPVFTGVDGWTDEHVHNFSLGSSTGPMARFVETVEHVVGLPVYIASCGPQARDKTFAFPLQTTASMPIPLYENPTPQRADLSA